MSDYNRVCRLAADRLNRIAELEEALKEAVDLMEDTISGEYTPDSFTTQPWKRTLEGSDE